MKLFDSDVEGKLPLRGVKPQQIPEETFAEIKISSSKKNETTRNSLANTDVEVSQVGSERILVMLCIVRVRYSQRYTKGVSLQILLFEKFSINFFSSLFDKNKNHF